jgi:uncharacterized small protein (DUF1192 family)
MPNQPKYLNAWSCVVHNNPKGFQVWLLGNLTVKHTAEEKFHPDEIKYKAERENSSEWSDYWLVKFLFSFFSNYSAEEYVKAGENFIQYAWRRQHFEILRICIDYGYGLDDIETLLLTVPENDGVKHLAPFSTPQEIRAFISAKFFTDVRLHLQTVKESQRVKKAAEDQKKEIESLKESAKKAAEDQEKRFTKLEKFQEKEAEEISTLKIALSGLAAENRRLVATVARLTAQIIANKKENDALKQALAEVKLTKETLSFQVVLIRNDRNRLAAQLTEAAQKNEVLNATVAELQAELAAIKKVKSEVLSVAVQVQPDTDEAEMQTLAVEQKDAEAQETLPTVMEESLQAELSQEQQAKRELEARFTEELADVRQTLRQTEESLQRQLTETEAVQQQVETKNAELMTKGQQSQEAIDHLETKVQTSQAENQKLADEAAKLTQSRQQLETKIEELQTQLATMQRNLESGEQTQIEIGKVREELAHTQQMLESLQQQSVQNDAVQQQLHAEVTELTTQLQERQTEFAALLEQMEKLVRENEQEKRNAKQNMTLLKGKLIQAGQIVAALSQPSAGAEIDERMKPLRDEIQRLQTELKKQEGMVARLRARQKSETASSEQASSPTVPSTSVPSLPPPKPTSSTPSADGVGKTVAPAASAIAEISNDESSSGKSTGASSSTPTLPKEARAAAMQAISTNTATLRKPAIQVPLTPEQLLKLTEMKMCVIKHKLSADQDQLALLLGYEAEVIEKGVVDQSWNQLLKVLRAFKSETKHYSGLQSKEAETGLQDILDSDIEKEAKRSCQAAKSGLAAVLDRAMERRRGATEGDDDREESDWSDDEKDRVSAGALTSSLALHRVTSAGAAATESESGAVSLSNSG